MAIEDCFDGKYLTKAKMSEVPRFPYCENKEECSFQNIIGKYTYCFYFYNTGTGSQDKDIHYNKAQRKQHKLDVENRIWDK